MCSYPDVPNSEGYSTLHMGNINPMITIRILDSPKVYRYYIGSPMTEVEERKEELYRNLLYCYAELLSIDRYTIYSKEYKKDNETKVIIPLLQTIYDSMLKNLREKNIKTDDPNCLIGKIFRIQYRRVYKTELIDKVILTIPELVPYTSNGKTKLCELYRDFVCKKCCEVDKRQLLDLVNYGDKTWVCYRRDYIFVYNSLTKQYEYEECNDEGE